MCFFIHPRHKKVKTAKKRITVWKTGKAIVDGFQTLSFNYKYERGKTNKPVLLFVYDNIIDEGYHSYSTYSAAEDSCWTIEDVFELYIPVGARYYYNPEDNQYVSNKIVFPKIK